MKEGNVRYDQEVGLRWSCTDTHMHVVELALEVVMSTHN